MYPIILSLGSFRLSAYMLFLAIGFCVCVFLLLRENARRTEPLPISALIGVWTFLGAMQGARMWHVLEQDGLGAWRDMLNPWEAGLAFHGGLAGGILAGTAYAWFVGAPVLRLYDVVLPFLALGEAITRIGCFLNGCCWGTVTHVPWAIQFPSGSFPCNRHVHTELIPHDALASLPVHPTQLYMVAGLALIFAGLRYGYRHAPFVGFSTALFLFAHGLFRFVIEFFRGDAIPAGIGLSSAQVMSLFMMTFAVVLFVAFGHKGGWKNGASLPVIEEMPSSE